MTKPLRAMPKRGKPSRDGAEARVRFFASAGSYYPQQDLPHTNPIIWLPFVSGDELRHDWSEAREQVKRRIPARAFALMAAEFDEGGPARSFTNWPRAEREELYSLCPEHGRDD